MNAWTASARAGLVSGTMAGMLSTAVAGALGAYRVGHAFAPTNATSQWVWGVEEASRALAPSVRHTLTGFVVHQAASLLWGTTYERMLVGTRAALSPGRIATAAAATTALAIVADYVLSPRRFTPGFEAHLRPAHIALVYAGFGAGLALATVLFGRRRRVAVQGRDANSTGAGS